MSRRRATHTAAALRKRHELVAALPTFQYIDLIPPAIALIGSAVAFACVAVAACVFDPPDLAIAPDPIPYAERADDVDVTTPILPADEIGPVPDPPAPTPAVPFRRSYVCRFCSPPREGHYAGEYGEAEIYDREPDEGGAPWRLTFPFALH